MKLKSYFLVLAIFAIASCNQQSTNQKNTEADSANLNLNKEDFQKTVDGAVIDLFTLKNENGIVVQVTNFGARLVSVQTPDRNGEFADISLGYTNIDETMADGMNLGCTVGRFANRIAKGTFELEGESYHLFINNGPNSLHGGEVGFAKKIWSAKQDGNRLEMTYTSPDMEEGYPGELKVNLTYELTEDNEFIMSYEAMTSKTTVLNLTNHAYFNLKGDGDITILDHNILINADEITPVDSTLIPTGDFMAVEGTPFDFRKGKAVGKDIGEDHIQLKYGGGYDHNWVLNKEPGTLSLAVRLSEPVTGRVIEYFTTEPGVQFYCGNFMNGTVTGKSGKKYQYRSGIAIEPQHFPDSPNHDNFPTTVLKPGEKFSQKTMLKFSVED